MGLGSTEVDWIMGWQGKLGTSSQAAGQQNPPNTSSTATTSAVISSKEEMMRKANLIAQVYNQSSG